MAPGLWQTRKRPIVAVSLIMALTLWGLVLKRQSGVASVHQHIDAGIEAVRAGQTRDAEREWQTAARLDPDNAAIWELLSTLYINTEQWSKGLDSLHHLQHAAPDTPYLYSRMAACALRTGNELEAQRLALLELKRNPGDEASLTIMAFLSSMQEDSAQQISYLQRLLARHPNNADTLHDMAQACFDAGKYADAMQTLNTLLAVKSNDGFAFTLRAATRYEIDASPAGSLQSESDLLKALQTNPLSAFARYTLGRIYLREGQFGKAIFQLELAQKLYPRKMDVPFELAIAYARAGQSAKAALARQRFEALRQEATEIAVLQKRCAVNPKDVAASLRLGSIMLQRGDLRQAYFYLQRALTLDPNNPEARAAYRQLAEQYKAQMPDSPH